jgi:Chlorite dismutase
MTARMFTFVGGAIGPWRIVRMETLVGEPLAQAARVNVINGAMAAVPAGVTWLLRGMTSHERYVTRQEKEHLVGSQPPLSRPDAICAALIPIRKSEAWWSLAQDERRRIFEERSGHIKTGLKYLPAIARRLHHCRDLGGSEPFDFLTWFEYAPTDSRAFDELAAELRASEEWAYVDREIDIRVIREPASLGVGGSNRANTDTGGESHDRAETL